MAAVAETRRIAGGVQFTVDGWEPQLAVITCMIGGERTLVALCSDRPSAEWAKAHCPLQYPTVSVEIHDVCIPKYVTDVDERWRAARRRIAQRVRNDWRNRRNVCVGI